MTLNIANYNNDLLKQDKEWWELRAWIIATDKGRGVDKINLEQRISDRRN